MRKREYRSMAEINVTNLVDVVLVLLIIFMISAPLLQSGIEVDLPKTKTAALDESAEGIVLTIDRKGGIWINDVWAARDKFETNLDRELRRINKSSVFLRADSLVPYGVVVDVMGRLKLMGIEELGLITAKEEDLKKKKK
ncbi:MAG: protein TolR [candidate division Zixibacteria bacterium HGW-Zixibacteria-1]|nr:MAG: protein TolR [candidate division Zixibacteria bacterium HGW-Zixibacteria-1]